MIVAPREYKVEFVNRKRYHSINVHGIVPAGCHLLGDSGYPSKKWLLTAYLRPQPGAQSSYNRAHKKTCSIVERGIGQLKPHFHMPHSEIQVGPPSKVCQIVEVCALLHNICKARNIILPEEEEHLAAAEDGGSEERPPAQKVQSRHEGILYRDEFVVLHFKWMISFSSRNTNDVPGKSGPCWCHITGAGSGVAGASSSTPTASEAHV
ncbi:putative nuclease HARBI1 [Portunus trituberculatus]|uniref:putative nuclease HARBI1 n=1 Tax=Portunus trituberculatus TaxID=210409 RepID=UPI001E1D1582|nr:putative nuclease HARBI1 [Portunus trituberculatus]